MLLQHMCYIFHLWNWKSAIRQNPFQNKIAFLVVSWNSPNLNHLVFPRQKIAQILQYNFNFDKQGIKEKKSARKVNSKRNPTKYISSGNHKFIVVADFNNWGLKFISVFIKTSINHTGSFSEIYLFSICEKFSFSHLWLISLWNFYKIRAPIISSAFDKGDSILNSVAIATNIRDSRSNSMSIKIVTYLILLQLPCQ